MEALDTCRAAKLSPPPCDSLSAAGKTCGDSGCKRALGIGRNLSLCAGGVPTFGRLSASAMLRLLRLLA